MEQHEAIALIGDGVTSDGGVWADLGAGTGVFTRAIASLLGSYGTVYAIDRDAGSLSELSKSESRGVGAKIKRAKDA